MTTRCFVVGQPGGGGEEVYIRELVGDPPPGIEYTLVMAHHESADGARCAFWEEVLFNRLVAPGLHPLHGLRAYSLDDRFALAHVHNFPFRLHGRRRPVVMTLGGATFYHYIRDYLGWEEPRIDELYDRAKRVHRRWGVSSEFTASEGIGGIAVFSEYARSFLLRRGVEPRRVHVIPPGFQEPTDSPAPAGPFTFLLVARDPPRKGADLVLEATRRLRAEGLQIRTLLVGHASFASNQDEGVEGHGWVDRAAVYRDFYPRAHAVLLPSRADGYGFALVEAMSFGRAVIASRYGAFPEIVDDGETGLLVEGGSAAALAEAMRRLASDPEATRRMGAAGRQRFQENFSRARYHARMAQLYQAALDTSG